MTRQIYRASSYQDRPQRAEGSIRDKAVWHDDELGFRLVVDTDVERVNRGRTWLYSGPAASVSHRVNVDPADTSTVCGFRLAKEGT